MNNRRDINQVDTFDIRHDITSIYGAVFVLVGTFVDDVTREPRDEACC